MERSPLSRAAPRAAVEEAERTIRASRIQVLREAERAALSGTLVTGRQPARRPPDAASSGTKLVLF